MSGRSAAYPGVGTVKCSNIRAVRQMAAKRPANGASGVARSLPTGTFDALRSRQAGARGHTTAPACGTRRGGASGEGQTGRGGKRGLFDDFGAFRTSTTEDFTAVLTRGLVAPDANVLLNLYRYTEQARGVADAKSVYTICHYPEGRSLRGFTKPVTRITGLLRSLGKIPESAVQVLKAEYDAGPGPASGFSVHPLLVPLVNELGDEDES